MRVIKGLIRFLWVVSIFVSSCYDDSELWEHIRDHENRITKLEDFCNQINNNLISLRNVIDAIQTREYVKDVIPVYDEGCCIGYTITFNGRDPITLLNGKNGTNAQTPIIGVKKDADGVWYWTLNGNWLLDESGSMVVASGRNGSDGHDGMDGSNGNDGIDGTNGITPQLIIENDNWMVSYDNGVNWQILGPAYQLNDKDECPVIKSITQDEHFRTIRPKKFLRYAMNPLPGHM